MLTSCPVLHAFFALSLSVQQAALTKAATCVLCPKDARRTLNEHSGRSAHVKYDGIALADRSSKHVHGRRKTGQTHIPKYGMAPAVAVLHAHTAQSSLPTWKCQARLTEYLQAVANGRVSVCCAHVSVYIQSEHQPAHTKHVSNCCTATHPVQVGRPPLHA